MNLTDKTEVLRTSALAAELDAAEREAIAERMGVVTLAAGELLTNEGEPRRTLFILAEGQVDVGRVDALGGEEIVHRMRPGECAGTRAFVDGSPRKALLRASAPSTVLTLEPDDFEALLDTQPRLVFKVMRAIFRSTHTNLMRMNQETAEMRNYVTRTGGRY